jgi:predicted nucleic acid-binding protein
MLVVDTSAIVGRLVADPPPETLADRLEGQSLHAPHLIDVEFLHVMRRMVARGLLAPARADVVRTDFSGLRITRYPHTLMLDRMWELRENLTAYDAAFVALAEALDAPLVTTDARLAASPGHRATIEAF